MIIKILPVQIPQLWETIKFAFNQSGEINKEDMPFYFNELLHALLSEKAQCWLRLNDDRNIMALMITRVLVDKFTNVKSLFIQSLYSWQGIEDKEWQNDFRFLKEFAIHNQCKHISFDSKNPRIWEVAGLVAFKETTRKFIREVN